MILEKNMTLGALENLYLQARNSESKTMAPAYSYSYANAFGLEAALIQLMGTWQRHHPNGVLELDCDSVEYGEYLAGAFAHPSNIASCYLCRDIRTTDGTQIKQAAALRSATGFVSAMWDERYGETSEKGTTALLCFRSASREFLPCFYKHPIEGAIRPKEEFIELMDRVVRGSNAKINWTGQTKSLVSSIGSLVYELIKNTDQHSLTDTSGNWYERGVRGLLVKIAEIDRQDLLVGYSGGNPNLLPYLNRRLGLAGSSAKKIAFLEASVVDTGPGMARRWLSKFGAPGAVELNQITLEQEREAVVTCFKKYMTTKESASSGMGLTAVLDHLRKVNGFIRVRTGRLSLFQALSEKDEAEGFSPLDWHKETPELPEAVGTVLTVCIPISLG